MLNKETVQKYLRNGLGQLVLDTSLLVIADQVHTVDSELVSVHVQDVFTNNVDLTGDRIFVSTRVETLAPGTTYGADLHNADPADAFLLFLQGAEPTFSIASVSSDRSALLGCFRIQSMDNLPAFIDTVLLLDELLFPLGSSSIPDDFPEQPGLPGCSGCLFLLQHIVQQAQPGSFYRCGRIWTPASLQGWLPEEILRQHGQETGPDPPACWTSLTSDEAQSGADPPT